MSIRTTLAAVAALALGACLDADNILEPVAEPSDPIVDAASGDCEPVQTHGPGKTCTPDPTGSDCILRRHLSNNYNLSDCKNTGIGGGDSDGDGLNDRCEYVVAHAFARRLKVATAI